MARLSWILLVVAAVCSSPAVDAETLGVPVAIEDYPSLAQVEVYFLGTWIQQCAGVVITNYHILSTAYCFSGSLYDENNRRIRVGTASRYDGGQLEYVQRVYNYPSYGSLGHDGDLSVVRLYSSLVFNDRVAQAMILGQGIDLPYGLAVENLGWGTTPQGGQSSNNQLYKLNLYVNHNDRCMMAYVEGENPQYITENMACVGLTYNTGRDFDSRDVGAPLFYENTLVGLLAFGRSDDEDTYPVVATSIGSYSDWIVATASTG